MSKSTWPQDLLAGSLLDADQYWSIFRGGVEEDALAHQHLSLVRKATGVDGTPDGNLRLTWSIRRYTERYNWLGSLPWLKALMKRSATQVEIFPELLHRLVQLFEISHGVGTELFLEQVTVLLAKDLTLSNPCLTPRLHADEYYGYRQTAVVSLLEKGWSVDGGTWFLPTISMCDIPDGDQILPEHIYHSFPETPIVAAGNGDFCIYDGMQKVDDEVNDKLGTAHISGDIPGHSSRLIILIHHRPAKAVAPSFVTRPIKTKSTQAKT